MRRAFAEVSVVALRRAVQPEDRARWHRGRELRPVSAHPRSAGEVKRPTLRHWLIVAAVWGALTAAMCAAIYYS